MTPESMRVSQETKTWTGMNIFRQKLTFQLVDVLFELNHSFFCKFSSSLGLKESTIIWSICCYMNTYILKFIAESFDFSLVLNFFCSILKQKWTENLIWRRKYKYVLSQQRLRAISSYWRLASALLPVR